MLFIMPVVLKAIVVEQNTSAPEDTNVVGNAWRNLSRL
jgi:hypothetical protein